MSDGPGTIDPAFPLHQGGKIEVRPTVRIRDREGLALAYTPGVARVSTAIAEDVELVGAGGGSDEQGGGGGGGGGLGGGLGRAGEGAAGLLLFWFVRFALCGGGWGGVRRR